jgi:rSAM/selenodomain-associated transferase 1
MEYNPLVSSRLLALFAKAPIPGQVKTRLSPPLSFAEAASLYEAMLLDILDQHAAASDADRVLWYAPPEAASWFEGAVSRGYRLRPQCGANLAARMRTVFHAHADEGYERVVLRGTDSPTLPLERISLAFEALERVDLVLCPDRDGGYNLIGLREPCDALFDLEMSTASVLAADLALIREALSEALTPRTLQWFRDARGRIGS